MARILYFDCFSGISGDMALGALIDAGVPLAYLRDALGGLAIADYAIDAERVLRAGMSAMKFRLHEGHESERLRHDHGHDHGHGHAHGHSHDHGPADAPNRPVRHGHRSLREIFGLIDTSGLSPAARERARAMFARLAEAEAAIHQMSVDEVHLHEVGALDSIIDVVGVVAALEWMHADRVVCSPLNVGGGMVRSAHGLIPVPAPATLRLLGGAPIYSGAVTRELVTPTGALIATTCAGSFGPIPPMTVERVGYGAGDHNDPGTPNVLRVLVGREADRAEGLERVVVVECEIDDMNPQIFGAVMDQLYAAGAREVFYVPVQMKKNRPGTLLTVVTDPERRAVMADVIFRETTTIGLRYHEVERECLSREHVTVNTPMGAVRFKVASRAGHVVNASPEFEDCARLAAASGRPIKEVQAIAIRSFDASKVRTR